MADELDGGGSLLHKYRILGKAGEGTFSEVLKVQSGLIFSHLISRSRLNSSKLYKGKWKLRISITFSIFWF